MTPERRFLQLCKGIVIKINNVHYRDWLFWFKGDKCLFDYNLKSGEFWVNYKEIWSIFESEFGLNYYQIKEFIRDMVEQHFNLNYTTPRRGLYILNIDFNNISFNNISVSYYDTPSNNRWPNISI